MVEHDRDVYRISGRDTVDVHQEPQGPIRVGYVDLVEDLVDAPVGPFQHPSRAMGSATGPSGPPSSAV